MFGVLAAFAVIVTMRAAWPQSAALTMNYQRGSALYKTGDFAAATPYFARALTLSEQEYGPDSSRTGHILKNLATVYAGQRKFALAEPNYGRALAIFEATQGRQDGLVAELVRDLGIAFAEQKKFAKAEPFLARTVKNLETVFGPNDSRVALAVYNQGYASEYLGDAAKAGKLYARALRVWKAQGPPDQSRIQAVKRRLKGLVRAPKTTGPSLARFLLNPSPSGAVRLKSPSGWHLQLAAYRGYQGAVEESRRLAKLYGSLFAPVGGLQLVQSPKGGFHRIGVGPMANHAAADRLCRTLKARGQACIVVRR
jgi:tetratricopeptide (TPR) repeat protein